MASFVFTVSCSKCSNEWLEPAESKAPAQTLDAWRSQFGPLHALTYGKAAAVARQTMGYPWVTVRVSGARHCDLLRLDFSRSGASDTARLAGLSCFGQLEKHEIQTAVEALGRELVPTGKSRSSENANNTRWSISVADTSATCVSIDGTRGPRPPTTPSGKFDAGSSMGVFRAPFAQSEDACDRDLDAAADRLFAVVSAP